MTVSSRFAKEEDIFMPDFIQINEELMTINKESNLVNHDDLNYHRFNWFKNLKVNQSYYASRFWEYPFAIQAAELRPGMKCADIGCGTTPFTAYLTEKVGKENVFGFDHKLLADDLEETHYSFGTRSSFVKKYGFNFIESGIDTLNAADSSYDVVFCISVLEHITDSMVKQRGLLEMVRILKPGGKLIITFDTGIQSPLNDPLRIISFTGLMPYGNINLTWPEKRFVQYEDMSMDVFGLVLYKDDAQIYLDQKMTKTLPRYEANSRYLKLTTDYNIDYTDILKVKDIHSRFGLLKVLAKHILNRY